MPTARTPESFLPLTPAVLYILLALADRERHGYGIMQEVLAITGGSVRLGPGTLYGSLKRMLADELVEADEPQLAGKDERRMYRLTSLGRRVLSLEAQRLEHLVVAARSKQLLDTQ